MNTRSPVDFSGSGLRGGNRGDYDFTPISLLQLAALVLVLSFSLSGCAGYVDGGYGGYDGYGGYGGYDGYYGGPDLYLFGDGYGRGRDARYFSHRGAGSRGFAHGGGGFGGHGGGGFGGHGGGGFGGHGGGGHAGGGGHGGGGHAGGGGHGGGGGGRR